MQQHTPLSDDEKLERAVKTQLVHGNIYAMKPLSKEGKL